MTNDILTFILSISGFLIVMCLGIIAYFLKSAITDAKDSNLKVQMALQKIEHVESKTDLQIEKLAEVSEQSMITITKEVGTLTDTVKTLSQDLRTLLIKNQR